MDLRTQIPDLGESLKISFNNFKAKNKNEKIQKKRWA